MPIKKRTLNRQKVIQKAAELADKAGHPEAVTLTALAAALDIRVPSLYNHVANFDDLQSGLALHAGQLLIGRLRQSTTGLVGPGAIIALTNAFRAFAHDHPGLYPLLITAPDPDDQQRTAVANEILQLFLLLLASCGLQGDPALHAIRGIRALTHGFITLEAAEGFKMPLNTADSYQLAIQTYLTGLNLLPTNDHNQ
jgi:AcrR family transcriptional regulator